MCRNKVPCSDPRGNGQVVYRSCGKCLDCLRQYQQDWTFRLSEECKAWAPESVIFFTLTYSDEHIPYLLTHVLPDNTVEQTICRGKVPESCFLFTRDSYHNTRKFRLERKCFCDSFLDLPEDFRPVIAAPTVYYDDINQWIRYCRKYFARHVSPLDYKGREVSPYLRSLSWEQKEGCPLDFPASAYTPSFKYFITSEYGPGTMRPHFHGVFFGVPEDMFRDVFAKWWIEHFGREKHKKRACDWSVYDSNRGGAMYIAKYCSKGSFDNPLQSKVIRYKSGKEFVSSSFINCLNWFGVDVPFVVPTFHLISKGIGIRYAFNPSIQKYWYSSCVPSRHSCICRDAYSERVPLSFVRSIPNLKGIRFVETNPFADLDVFLSESCRIGNSVCHLYRVDTNSRKDLGQSDFVLTSDPRSFEIFKQLLFNKKCVRRYEHDGKIKTFELLLPRYYRRFLLSPLANFALQDAVSCSFESRYSCERRQYGQIRSRDEKENFLSEVQRNKRLVQDRRTKDLQSRYGRFYSREFKGDVQ